MFGRQYEKIDRINLGLNIAKNMPTKIINMNENSINIKHLDISINYF